jgi:hypothetical protein
VEPPGVTTGTAVTVVGTVSVMVLPPVVRTWEMTGEVVTVTGVVEPPGVTMETVLGTDGEPMLGDE